MQITPVAQDNVATQAAPVVPKQDTQPVQAPEPQKPRAPQKDEVILSQAAKDLAAQVSSKTAQEETKESPAIAMQEGGLTKVIK